MHFQEHNFHFWHFLALNLVCVSFADRRRKQSWSAILRGLRVYISLCDHVNWGTMVSRWNVSKQSDEQQARRLKSAFFKKCIVEENPICMPAWVRYIHQRCCSFSLSVSQEETQRSDFLQRTFREKLNIQWFVSISICWFIMMSSLWYLPTGVIWCVFAWINTERQANRWASRVTRPLIKHTWFLPVKYHSKM